MAESFLSNSEFMDVLSEKGAIQQGDGFVVGAVKKTDRGDTIQISLTGVSDWVEIPIKMIETAKIVGTAIAGADRYPVVLIKLADTNDVFAKTAYALLAHIGTVSRGREGSSEDDCGCSSKCKSSSPKDDPKQADDVPASLARVRSPFGQPATLSGGFGMWGGIGASCRFEFECYSCTRCIPWTNTCWSSTCCDLVAVDCDVSI